jgi:CHAD domain-containing protein
MTDFAPDAVPETPTLYDYAAELLTARLERMLAQAAGVRAGKEIEPIHQMRVWSRRSRAALDVFRPCFEGKAFQAIEAEVKKVTRALGAARDLDVMIESLARREAELPPEQQAGIESFIATLRRERRGSQGAVKKAMMSLEAFDLRARFTTLLAKGPAAGARGKRNKKESSGVALDPERPILVNAARIIGARLDELIDYERYLYDSDEVYEQHQMRIAAKRLRYTLEMFVESVRQQTPYEEEYTTALETVRTFQEHLGEIHDADVLVPRLLEHLNHLLAEGYGVEKSGEPVAGVHRVDIDACEGLLVLCREARALRDRHYRRLVRDWERAVEGLTFERLRALLREAALTATKASVKEPDTKTEPDTNTEEEPPSPPPNETQHGEDKDHPAESLPPAPRRRSRRRAAAAPLGHSGSGTDPRAGTGESGL